MKKKFYQQQEELKHFGILGMKWGRRKASGSSGVGDYNRAVDRMNSSVIKRINNKPEYKGKDLSKNPKLLKKYNAEMQSEFEKTLSKESKRKVSDPELEVSRRYVKNYLTLAAKAIVAGLVVREVALVVANAYVAAQAIKRYKDLIG